MPPPAGETDGDVETAALPVTVAFVSVVVTPDA